MAEDEVSVFYSKGEWYFDDATRCFHHLKAGTPIPRDAHIKDEDIDVVIPDRLMITLIQYIQKRYPTMISLYNTRDKEDVKIINRLLDIINKQIKV